MRKVKDLQKWISGYNEIKSMADETSLAFEYYKEELVTEGEVDQNYAKTIEAFALFSSLPRANDPDAM